MSPLELIFPVKLNEPDTVISYAESPVKASIDWVTCQAAIVESVVIPYLDNVFAIV